MLEDKSKEQSSSLCDPPPTTDWSQLMLLRPVDCSYVYELLFSVQKIYILPEKFIIMKRLVHKKHEKRITYFVTSCGVYLEQKLLCNKSLIIEET